jgi:hypothetical protein
VVETVKEEFGCLECFSPLPTHLTRPERTFYQPRTGVGSRNNNSFGVKEGAVMASGEYLQRGVRQGLRVVHKAQQKVVQIGVVQISLVLAKKKFKKNSHLSPSY